MFASYLKAKSLLSIIKDEKDKRKHLLKLSDTGQRLKLKATDIPDKVLCKFPGITPLQTLQLMGLLDWVVGPSPPPLIRGHSAYFTFCENLN
tara:strand:- start:1249 stop:1524 length:276 start_codon:yes stop_codon:yes gene_type:complete